MGVGKSWTSSACDDGNLLALQTLQIANITSAVMATRKIKTPIQITDIKCEEISILGILGTSVLVCVLELVDVLTVVGLLTVVCVLTIVGAFGTLVVVGVARIVGGDDVLVCIGRIVKIDVILLEVEYFVLVTVGDTHRMVSVPE